MHLSQGALTEWMLVLHGGGNLAAAFPRDRFEQVREAGHLPHLEPPTAVLALMEEYCAGGSRPPPATA